MVAFRLDRRRLLSGSAACIGALSWGGPVRGQAYPVRPLHLLVGFPAGSAADAVARLVGDGLQARLGQPVIVENRPGAATAIATEAVVRAAPDGYTLLLATSSNVINNALFDDLKHDFIRDIAPVIGLVRQPLVLLASPALPAANLPAFVAQARAQPGAINLGNFGTGTIGHLAGEAFKRGAGIDLVAVPYRGTAAMHADLATGRIQAAFDNLTNAAAQIRSGRLRALGMASSARLADYPDIPAISELVPGFEALSLSGIGVPRDTPAPVVATLNAAAGSVLAEAGLGARLTDQGMTVLGGTPEAFGELVARETRRWSELIRSAGIKAS